jgi:hypothetical protein
MKSARLTALGAAEALQAFTLMTIERSTTMPPDGTTGSVSSGSTPLVV